MSNIINALVSLNESLELLEMASAEQEQKVLKVKQQDLFNAAPAMGNGIVTNGNNAHRMIDTAVLAKKLDITIEKFEQILGEG